MSARETEMVPPEREEENKKREASQGIREEHVSSRLWSSKTSAVKISSKKKMAKHPWGEHREDIGLVGQRQDPGHHELRNKWNQ